MHLHADFSQPVALDTSDMEWVPSPMAGVDRRMLDRIGDEVARATSIVRYAPESYFSPHTHGGGEEFLVLEGTFVDEHGDYPVGSYVRNPVGSAHTPSSPEGCVIFVKLWQMDPADQRFVRMSADDLPWTETETPGVEVAALHHFGDEKVSYLRFGAAGGTIAGIADGGTEFLVVRGTLAINGVAYGPQAWVRLPDGAAYTLSSDDAAMVWQKTGHLRDIVVPG